MRSLALPRLRWLFLGVFSVGMAGLPLASTGFAGPLLHELFAADPAEDLLYAATTPSGALPAVIETKSGSVAAPDESLLSAVDPASVYGGHRTQTSPDSSYHLDRLTTRPESVVYDEPFRPSVLPFKRLYAFDRLGPDGGFSVKDASLSVVNVGGVAAASEDAFYSDLVVELVRGVPVRIPSVGPGARIRSLHVDPPLPVTVLEDSAENWFVRAEQTARARLVMQLTIERQVFGSLFRPVSFGDLAPHLPPLPAPARAAGLEVARAIGVQRSASPAGVLIKLVDYFRRFHESSELPTAKGALDLYKEIALTQKGVCRHRAYAFAVTALAVGLPTRLVTNEAHAWVEVFDTEIWHRVDLGGAATNITRTRPDANRQHRPPPDPYSWPRASQPTLDPESGQFRNHAASAAPSEVTQLSPSSKPKKSDGDEIDGPTSADVAQGAGSNSQTSGDHAAVTTASPGPARGQPDGALGSFPQVTLRLKDEQLLRGTPLFVEGQVTQQGRPCPSVRVDVSVSDDAGYQIPLGSVATNNSGEFSGHVTLPQDARVGPMHVVANAVGDCSPRLPR